MYEEHTGIVLGTAETGLQPAEGKSGVQSGIADPTSHYLHYVRALTTLKPLFTHYNTGVIKSNF